MTILDVIKWVVGLSAWWLIPYFLFMILCGVASVTART